MAIYGVQFFPVDSNAQFAYLKRVPENLIQTARQSRRWTVADLAARVGVSPRTVEGWEQGKAPSGPARIALERVLKIKLP